jgi:hypothetical protein
MNERELKVKTTFEKFIQVALIRLKKLYDITFEETPEVQLVSLKYNVYNGPDTFEVYVNTFTDGDINEKFESILRETCRFVQLHNEYTYQLFLNTIVPEMFDSLISSAEKFKTELKDYLSSYDSEDSKFVVEYVKPENTNWRGGENMTVRVIVTLYTKDTNNDKLRKAGEKTLDRVLTRMINNNYSDFEGYSLYMDVEEMDNNTEEELPYDEEINESYRVRVFSESIEDEELKWHRDRQDRLVEVIDSKGWELQFDNEIPVKLKKGMNIIIPEGTYHRVIKGDGDLKIKITFI